MDEQTATIQTPKKKPTDIWILDRVIKWVHDSLIVIGLGTVYLLVSGHLIGDIGAELKERYEKQMAAAKSNVKSSN